MDILIVVSDMIISYYCEKYFICSVDNMKSHLNFKCNRTHTPSVCELDLVFSLHKSLMILFEMFIGGMLCESNRREVLQKIVEAEEMVEQMTKPGEDTSSQLDDGLSFQEQFQLGRKPGARGPRGTR